jgi:preprotein translocase subunit SecD
MRPVVEELPPAPCSSQPGVPQAVLPEVRLGLPAACFRLGPVVFTMSRKNVASASAVQGPNGWTVQIALTPKAAIEFDDAVGRYRGQQVALVSGNRVLAAPQINALHFNGRAEVSGLDAGEARRLAAGLHA